MTKTSWTALADQLDEVLARLGAVPDSRGDYRYAPGKWTLKEVVGHLADTERVFAYRALRIARGDTVPLPAFDDQAWVAEMGAGGRTLADMVEEFEIVRRASLALFRHLPAGGLAAARHRERPPGQRPRARLRGRRPRPAPPRGRRGALPRVIRT